MHISDKVAHEACVLDYRGLHKCPLARDLIGHVRGTDLCNCMYTKLCGRDEFKICAV